MAASDSSTILQGDRPPQADLRQLLADACGMRGAMRLKVRNLETGELAKHDFSTPFLLLGRDASCDLPLHSPEVSARHAYLQIIDGRLQCFDVGSRTGMRFNDALRHEGELNRNDSLVVGPFQIQLSQAPAYWTPDEAGGGIPFENSPADDLLLQFGNATGRSQEHPVRRLRTHVTLLGRNKRCHVKLSHASVGRIHAVVVRTAVGVWLVDLRPDRATLVNDRPLTDGCAPLEPSDRITLGEFKMSLVRSRDSRVAVERAASESEESEHAHSSELAASTETNGVLNGSVRRKRRRVRSESAVVEEAATKEIDPTVRALIDEFGQMHRQVLEQTHQQTLMMAQVMGAIQQSQDATIHQQLAQIQAITEELTILRRPRIEHETGGAETAGAEAATAPVPEPTIDADHVPKRSESAASPSFAELDSTADELPPQTDAATSGDATEDAVNAAEAQSEAEANPVGEQGAERGAPNAAEVYRDITFRINELERQRSSSWRRIMSLLGMQDSVN